MSNDNAPQQHRWHEWTLGDRLRVAREKSGYDQRQFEAVTGISRATIYKYENGKSTPRPPMLAAWCLATGFSKHWILTGELPPEPDNAGDASDGITMRKFPDNTLKVAA